MTIPFEPRHPRHAPAGAGGVNTGSSIAAEGGPDDTPARAMPDPGLVKLVEALARAQARRDHLIATGQLEPKDEPSDLASEGNQARGHKRSERGPGVRLRKTTP